jgi:hypothetical protein
MEFYSQQKIRRFFETDFGVVPVIIYSVKVCDKTGGICSINLSGLISL